MVSDATIREKKLQKIIELEKVLSQIQDTDVLLERILTEARAIVHGRTSARRCVSWSSQGR